MTTAVACLARRANAPFWPVPHKPKTYTFRRFGRQTLTKGLSQRPSMPHEGNVASALVETFLLPARGEAFRGVAPRIRKYKRLYWGYIGLMEKKMESTIV